MQQDIPGITLFDGDQAQKGFALNCMCFSFNNKRAGFIAHRNYHVPISNTAAATMVLENRALPRREAA